MLLQGDLSMETLSLFNLISQEGSFRLKTGLVFLPRSQILRAPTQGPYTLRLFGLQENL